MRTTTADMKDVQGSLDFRNMPIEKVGIRNIRYPITVRDKSHETQQTVANVTLSVNLPHTNRGTHMSRFVEVLDRFKNEVSYQSLDLILIEIKKALKAEESHIELRVPVLPEEEGAGFGAGIPHVLRLRDRGHLHEPPGDRHPRGGPRAHPLSLLQGDRERLRAQPARDWWPSPSA